MSLLQRNLDLFEDNSEIASIKQDFILLYAEVQKAIRSNDKVRKCVFAEVGELKKENLSLKEEIKEIKKLLNPESESEKVTNFNDLPLFKFSDSKHSQSL